MSNPPNRPLPAADAIADAPLGFAERPSLDGIPVIAADQSRAGGERFALATALTISDTVAPESGAELLARIGSPTLSSDLSAFLIDDYDGQRAIPSERTVDYHRGFWFRSRAHGNPEAPDRIDAEVWMPMLARPLRVRSWYWQGVGITWEGGRWRMTDYRGGGFGPDGVAPLTPAQRRKYLDGPGWRQVPPVPAD